MRSLVLFFASLVLACSSTPPPATATSTSMARGCDAPEYHRLDFWLGEWDVRDPRGAYLGTNVVTRALRGCAIEERWTDAEGRGGFSLFYYDRALGLWKQVW